MSDNIYDKIRIVQFVREVHVMNGQSEDGVINVTKAMEATRHELQVCVDGQWKPIHVEVVQEP